MKNTLILLAGVLLFACGKSNTQTTTEAPALTPEVVASFDWLIGKWVRLNDEEGKETFENWVKLSDFEYKGIGFTLQNGDTVSQELMKINQINDVWELKVSTPDFQEPEVFMNSKLRESEFVFENNEIDFPNVIRYWKEGDKMKATIANDEMEIAFEFEKVN